ncbi:hypothetical protein HZ326_13013 [Fusarium oxysporum f. sp. albedinis]|nr:hypothetical protein HZ326_13013 [Fusarium oxysporum f. sp. albedinis]
MMWEFRDSGSVTDPGSSDSRLRSSEVLFLVYQWILSGPVGLKLRLGRTPAASPEHSYTESVVGFRAAHMWAALWMRAAYIHR